MLRSHSQGARDGAPQSRKKHGQVSERHSITKLWHGVAGVLE